ncbi:MAG: extracellular solute-binding protein family 5 [Firmicutes bacterium]|nr:extracellular solute-binding protein family 5 [Bacillota bacterium]
MRRFPVWIAMPLAVALLLAACTSTKQTPSGSETNKPSAPNAAAKNLTYIQGVDISSFDPAFVTDRPTQTVLRHIFENLVDTDPATGGVRPWLATSWKVSDDKKQWTFQLKSGAKFSDGTPVNAAAVKATLDRLRDPKLAAANLSLISSVVSVEAPGDLEVRITTKEPFAPLLENLAHPGGAILPVGFDPKSPVGSGPYKLQERQSGVKVVLSRNPNYAGTPPVWAQIIYKPVPEPSARSVALEAGEAQIVDRLPPESVADLKNNSKVEVLVKPSTFQISFEINNRMKPFDDPRVRRALNLAVDKEALIKGLLRGMGSVPAGPVPPGAQWPMQLKPYAYNADEAKKLLAEAGVKPGQPIEIWTSQGRYAKDKEMAEAVSGYLQAVGFAPTIKVMEWGTYSKAIEDPNKSAALYILGSSVPTLDWRLTRNFLSNSTNNLSGYKNAEVDTLLLQARTVFEDSARKDLYEKVQTKVWDDAPYLFLFNQVQIIGVQKGLTGLTVYGHEILDFTQTKMAE